MTDSTNQSPIDSDSHIEIPLPTSADKLFISSEDWWDNACLDFAQDGWSLYAIGYKDASDLLVSHLEESFRHQDSLVYPILFMYRQYLELALKGLIQKARRLQDIDEPFPKVHRIDELWKGCSQLLSQISPGDSEEEQNEIGRLIGEFSRVDPTATAFRYPEDKEGNPSLPGIDFINLRNVRDVIGKISVILEGADAQISEYLSIKRSLQSNYF